MSNISQKLTYLNGTKSLIKDGINALGGELTNQSTFRSYANVLNDLYEVFPKVESEETTSAITLSPTQKAKMKLGFKGQIQQDSTTGKNLFNEWHQGYMDTTTGAISTGQRNLSDYISVQASTEYTLWRENTGFATYIGEYDSSKTPLGIYTLTSSMTTRTITTSSNTAYLVLYQYTNYSPANKAQLELGSTASTYEPYTGGSPSPSPSYPQDIHNVSGDNEIRVCNKNLINSTAYNKAISTSGGVIIPATTANYLSINDYVSVKPNTTYTISFEKEDGGRLLIGTKDQNGEFIKRTDLGVTRTFTTGNNVYQVFLYLYKVNGSYTEGGWVQLEKGSTATDYVEHKEYTKEINLPVENLFDKDNVVKVDNKILNDSGVETSDSGGGYTKMYIPTIPNTQYTISGLGSSGTKRIYYFDSTKTFISRTSGFSGTSKTITTPSNCYYLDIQYATSGNDFNTYQLEKGSKANSYTPYGTTPIEVGGIGEYEDEFFKNTIDSEYYDSTLEQDKWYLKKRIGKIVLDGSETNWQMTSGSAPFELAITDMYRNNDLATIMSNYYIAVSYNSNWNTYNYLITCNSTANNIPTLKIKNIDISNLADFKTWLSTHNTIVYYVLATPQNILLNDTLQETLDSFYSMQGQTNISQENNDLPFVIKARALKDFTTLE